MKSDSLQSKNLFLDILAAHSADYFKRASKRITTTPPPEHKKMYEMKQRMKRCKMSNEKKTQRTDTKKGTEQIDNFIFIGYQIKFILVISLFIHEIPEKL